MPHDNNNRHSSNMWSVTSWIHHYRYQKSNSTRCTEHSWPFVLTNPQEPTKISARLLKAAAPAITVSVRTLIDKIIVSGNLPTLWKLAKFTPIHEKGPTVNNGNYRPISVLCALSKILDRHVHDSLYTYLMLHNMLLDGQSGFRVKHLCETALNHISGCRLRTCEWCSAARPA